MSALSSTDILVGLTSGVLSHRVIRVRRPVGFLFSNGLARARIDTFRHWMHGDATVDRAYADTQVTANTFLVDDFETTLTADAICNSLVAEQGASTRIASKGDSSHHSLGFDASAAIRVASRSSLSRFSATLRSLSSSTSTNLAERGTMRQHE